MLNRRGGEGVGRGILKNNRAGYWELAGGLTVRSKVRPKLKWWKRGWGLRVLYFSSGNARRLFIKIFPYEYFLLDCRINVLYILRVSLSFSR